MNNLIKAVIELKLIPQEVIYESGRWRPGIVLPKYSESEKKLLIDDLDAMVHILTTAREKDIADTFEEGPYVMDVAKILRTKGSNAKVVCGIEVLGELEEIQLEVLSAEVGHNHIVMVITEEFLRNNPRVNTIDISGKRTVTEQEIIWEGSERSYLLLTVVRDKECQT